MKVRLGKFLREGLEEVGSGDLATDVQIAIHFYADSLRRGRELPVPVPLGTTRSAVEDATEVTVVLDPALRLLLDERRDRPFVAIEDLALHAAFVYLAARDRDRAAAARTVGI